MKDDPWNKTPLPEDDPEFQDGVEETGQSGDTSFEKVNGKDDDDDWIPEEGKNQSKKGKGGGGGGETIQIQAMVMAQSKAA